MANTVPSPFFNPYVTTSDVPSLIRHLRDFFGTTVFNKALKTHNKALKLARPVTRDYFVKTRHPWFEGLSEFQELERKGQPVSGQFSERILKVAADANTLLNLQPQMPKSVQKKFRSNLLTNHAGAHILELIVAWHFRASGYDVKWYEDTEQPHPEFNVIANGFDCDVECKHIGIDSFRKIRRQDFYELIDCLMPKLRGLELHGNIEIVLPTSLPQHQPKLKQISHEIIHTIKKGNMVGTFRASFGRLTVKMTSNTRTPVDFLSLYQNMRQTKAPEAHGAIIVDGYRRQPVDPIEFICTSEQADNVLEGIKEKIADACDRQLNPKKLSIVCCYIPEIMDFTGLESNSGLQLMTHQLFEDDNRNHVAAVMYNSEMVFEQVVFGKAAKRKTLTFRNQKCKYTMAKTFSFFPK